MKKFAFILSVLVVSCFKAQEHQIWRWGVSVGTYGNKAEYAGGDPIANSRFVMNDFGAGSLNLVARYDATSHWMGSIGLGFTNYGFEYGIARDYKIASGKRNVYTQKAEFSALEIPFMLHYKFNTNCKMARWVIGAGFSGYLTSSKTIQSTTNTEATPGIELQSISQNSGSAAVVRWSIAREKIFKNGHIFNASLVWNYGLGHLATTTVNYTLDNVNYSHNFVNSGNYFGVKLSWFFKPHVSQPKRT